MPVPAISEEVRSGHTDFYQRFDRWMALIPYMTLALGFLLGQFIVEQDVERRLITAGVAVAAALWVYLTYTRLSPQDRERPFLVAIYFAGVLAFAAMLMWLNQMFFIFAITGFFHAHALRKWPLTLLGVGATSAIVNSGFFESEVTAESVAIYLTIVVIQTLAIGGGHLIGWKLEQVNTERQVVVVELEAALAENAGLHMQLLTQAREAGVLDERQRMAREIHDTVAQGLTGIIAQLQAAQNQHDSQDERKRHLDTAAALARESLEEARRSVKAVGPPILETARLPDALSEVASRWSRINHVSIEFSVTGEPVAMHPEIEVTLLRTAQEALANIGKHAQASRAGITLSYMEEIVTLDVRDDGRGFVVEGAVPGEGNGYGLTAMRQRVTRLAGQLSIESEPGGGTAISAILPAIPQVATGE